MYFPIFYILTTSKKTENYVEIFNQIKIMLKKENIEWNIKNFTCDYEKALWMSLKFFFKNININGCYFHFAKCLWKKINKLKLNKKEDSNKILKFVGFLKIIPFIKEDKKYNFFINICNLFKKLNFNQEIFIEKFNKFIIYFKKYWLNNLDFKNIEFSNNKFFCIRTNNACESYNKKLNLYLKQTPKLSKFLEIIIKLTKESYKYYIQNMTFVKKENKGEISLLSQIYKFYIFIKENFKNLFDKDNYEETDIFDNFEEKISFSFYSNYFIDNFININIKNNNDEFKNKNSDSEIINNINFFNKMNNKINNLQNVNMN